MKAMNSPIYCCATLTRMLWKTFFGAIPAHGYINIMPTSSAFESAFQTLLINNISSSHSVGSNYEKDDIVYLQSLRQFLTKHIINETATECEEIKICIYV